MKVVVLLSNTLQKETTNEVRIHCIRNLMRTIVTKITIQDNLKNRSTKVKSPLLSIENSIKK